MNAADKIYVTLCLLFSALVITSNVTYQKFVTIINLNSTSLELSVGAVIYPLTFMINDLIVEFYGKVKARFCVRAIIFVNIIVAIILYFMSKLPATSWSRVDDEIFSHVFGAYHLAIFASMTALYCSQVFDIIIYSQIKQYTKGKYLWLRNTVSTALSLLVDTTMVTGILVFFSILPKDIMWSMIFSSYEWKLLITICNTPLFYLLYYIIRPFERR